MAWTTPSNTLNPHHSRPSLSTHTLPESTSSAARPSHLLPSQEPSPLSPMLPQEAQPSSTLLPAEPTSTTVSSLSIRTRILHCQELLVRFLGRSGIRQDLRLILQHLRYPFSAILPNCLSDILKKEYLQSMNLSNMYFK